MTGDLLFFGYYTVNTPYEQEFAALEFYLKAHNLQYDYKAVDGRGSWQKNTQMKAEVVEEYLVKYPGRRLCYLDVDSVIISRPDRLFEIESDLAAVLFSGQELLSGVVLFQNNDRTIHCVKRWREANKLYPEVLPDGRAAWDQRTLWMAIKDGVKNYGLKFEELPPAYNFIADLSRVRYPNVNPVILATRGASRFKAQIDKMG